MTRQMISDGLIVAAVIIGVPVALVVGFVSPAAGALIFATTTAVMVAAWWWGR